MVQARKSPDQRRRERAERQRRDQQQRQGGYGGDPRRGGAGEWGAGRQGGGYSIGKGGGEGNHPAHAYGSIRSAEGHFRYCWRLLANARDGRAGTQMAFGHLRQEIMRASKLSPDEKRYLIRRLRREYRGLSASFNAQARRAARVARVRQDADEHVASGAIRAKEMQGRGWGGWASRIG